MSDLENIKRTIASIRTGAELNHSGVQSALRSMAEAREAQTAKGFYDRIAERIRKFESSLDDQHEVGVKLASFGQSITFSISQIGYIDPLLIVFHGHTEGGDPIELIQHVNQISFVLIRLERKEPENPKRPIGFMSERDGA